MNLPPLRQRIISERGIYGFPISVKLIKAKIFSPNMLFIRRVRKRDFEDFVRLHHEFIKIYKKVSRYKVKQMSKRMLKREFDSRFGMDKFFYFARDGRLAIGYVFGYIEKSHYENYGYIDDIFVSKKYRGKGVSTSLKNNILEDFKRKGVKYCRMDVNTENKRAIQRYREWGFEVDKFRLTKKI